MLFPVQADRAKRFGSFGMKGPVNAMPLALVSLESCDAQHLAWRPTRLLKPAYKVSHLNLMVHPNAIL